MPLSQAQATELMKQLQAAVLAQERVKMELRHLGPRIARNEAAIFGNGDGQGLRGEVGDVRAVVSRVERLVWAVAASVIGLLISTVGYLIIRFVLP